MKDLIQKYSTLKLDLKSLRSELSEAFAKDSDHAALHEDLKATSEALRSYRKKLLSESPEIGGINARLITKRQELKAAKEAIFNNVKVVDSATGDVVQLAFSF